MKLALTLLLFTASMAISQKKETYVLTWPEKEWIQAQNDVMPEFTSKLFLRPGETISNWTELGSMINYNQVEQAPLDTFMFRIYRSTLQVFGDAKLTCISKNEKAACPVILFKIDVPGGNKFIAGESELVQLTVGKQGLYSLRIAVKRKEITDEEVKKWGKFFRKGKVVLQ